MATFRNAFSIAAGLTVVFFCLMPDGKVFGGDIDGVPLGGVCTRCGNWVPAGQSHACWTPSPTPFSPAQQAEDRKDRERRQKAQDLNNKGNGHFSNGNYERAVSCYLEALNLDPQNPVYGENLRIARAWAKKLADQRTREEQERKRRAAEAERKRHFEQTQAEIKRIAADLDKIFGRGASGSPASGLDFMGANDALFDEEKTSSPGVDLRFVGMDEPLVIDPRVVRGEMSAESARKDRNAQAQTALNRYVDAVAKNDIGLACRHLADALRATPYNRAIREAYATALKLRDERARQHVKNRKVTVLLDALRYGKSNWRASLMYLKKRYEADPADPFVRDAFYFIAGVSDNVSITLPDLSRKTGEIDDATHKLIADALVISMRGGYQEAFDAFSRAHEKYPEDQSIRDILNFTEGLLAAQQAQATGLPVHDGK